MGMQCGGVQGDQDRQVMPADRLDILGAGQALEFGLQAMGYPSEILGAQLWILAPEGQSDDGDILDGPRSYNFV